MRRTPTAWKRSPASSVSLLGCGATQNVLDFVGWLRAYNESVTASSEKVGFYGLVLGYLDKIDPEASRRARYRYSCFEHFGRDTESYAYATSLGIEESCKDEAVQQLIELQRRAAEYAHRDGRVAEDEFFYAEQNARLVKNAEQYYRSMFDGSISSWNLRDRHMAETLDALTAHLERPDRPAKIVVWEHNSHLGDARATEMGRKGELNVGQLVREKYGRQATLVGYSTYRGTVTAASDWNGPAERKR